MWYSARLLYERLLYQSRDGDKLADQETLFEEKLIVFRAEEEDDIVGKLTIIARNANDEYEAAARNWVKWVFREILEIQQVMAHGIEDGTEVYYRWWDNPSERDFQLMRETQEPPWWLSGSLGEATEAT
jgi:hypothetical protein